MHQIIWLDKDGVPHVNLVELVERYLAKYNVILYERQYYLYNAQTGIWQPKGIEEIQLNVARFFQHQTTQKWHVGYKKEVIERLKVEITEVDSMECPSTTLICMKNGVYDMATGKFSKFSPEYYFTSGLQIRYNPKAQCRLFSKFLKQISCNKRSRRETLEEFLGLSLVREVGKGQAMILCGAGRNGKSVYSQIACKLVGQDRWTTVTLKEMPNFGTAVLKGKTLAVITEIDKMTSNSLMVNELKQALTGENMQANEKYKPLYTFRPFASILILSNHAIGLEFDDTDGALRRLHIFPAEYQIPDSEVDIHLEEKLSNELEGIFLLAAEGYRRLKSNNYTYSAHCESDRLITEMLERENPLRAFVKEAIEMCPNHFITYEEIRRRFIEWCDAQGIEHTDISTDSKKISLEVSKQYNTSKSYKSNGKRGLLNIKFKEPK